LQKQIDEVRKTLERIQLDPPLQDHQHNGFESSFVEHANIAHKKLYVHHTIYGADAATAANYGVFWIVPIACIVTDVQEIHQILATDASAVTLNIEKLTGTEALDAGVNILGSEISLKATINSVQTGTLTTTLVDRSLVAGDRLAMNDTGTLTALVNVTIRVELRVV